MTTVLGQKIKALCQTETFSVLATQGQEQPYTSLVGFSISEDLKQLAFATPKETRKYTLLRRNKKVALMIDDRSDQHENPNEISALTITGHARILIDREEEKWRQALIEKHSYMTEFLRLPDTAILIVEGLEYSYVEKLQQVSKWSPK